MSAPDTDAPRGQNRPAPALFGIRGVLVFGALMMLAVLYLITAGSGGSPVGVAPSLGEGQ